MSIFNTAGKADLGGRKENTQRKFERMNKALRHEEPDRVPISDFFWGSFTERWRKDLGLPADANPYYHYDLDWIVTVPNMDPWIRPFETLKEDAEEVVVRTCFGAIMHKHFQFPMPEMRAWETDSFEKLERIQFDDTTSSGFVLPVDTVRVRLFFRKVDGDGTLHRYSAEQIIKMRNGV